MILLDDIYKYINETGQSFLSRVYKSRPAQDYSRMRVRDLKRYLLSIGISETEISQHLDKTELIKLATIHTNNNSSGVPIECLVLLMVAIGLCMYHSRKYMIDILNCVLDGVNSYLYPIRLKLPSIRYSWRKRQFIALLCLVISIVLDLFEIYVSMSTIASWIIPYGSKLRMYLAPTLPCTLSPNMLGKTRSQRDSFILSSGVNVGPMLTIWISRYVRKWLESKAAESLMYTHDS